MGTNYYVKDLEDPYDDGPGWHIGKQSFGHAWCWADDPNESDPIAERWHVFAAANSSLSVVNEYGEDCGPLLNFVLEPRRAESDNHAPGKGWS